MKAQLITFRLDKTTVHRAQALISLLSIPGRPATLSDVYRAIILTGLEVMEKSKPPNLKKPRPPS